jgi:ferric iron reductase protein FhuF
MIDGFNLGVEMARKEFLDKLESHNWIDDKAIWENGEMPISELIQEIKQSLGEKTE